HAAAVVAVSTRTCMDHTGPSAFIWRSVGVRNPQGVRATRVGPGAPGIVKVGRGTLTAFEQVRILHSSCAARWLPEFRGRLTRFQVLGFGQKPNRSHSTTCRNYKLGGTACPESGPVCALRSDRPKRSTVALRASV